VQGAAQRFSVFENLHDVIVEGISEVGGSRHRHWRLSYAVRDFAVFVLGAQGVDISSIGFLVSSLVFPYFFLNFFI